ncbi:RuBisCO accumulation factor 1 [Synechocystis sp. LKSZ1]|uniref:RuBisCO accumulation factor 1 n=1 Tax=Synechocystis sp. LKSZ1 TaxID=3144951 RepID=UPI00336BF961
MNEASLTPTAPLSDEATAALFQALLHKQGSWVDWGHACQQLQRAGLSADRIFEETGFQKVQQNLIIVAAQVYDSLVKGAVEESVLAYYLGPKSDVLYELRILNQEQRVLVAIEAQHHKLEADGAKELARAFQEFAYLSQLPTGFSHHPGDALAYQCWKLARQKRDLGERTRLIAKGLKFAHSASARAAVEQLLTDMTQAPTAKAPLIPLYRLEQDEAIPRLVPVVGTLPLTAEALKQVAPIQSEEPFGVVTYEGTGALAPIPGWQAVLTATDPVVIFCQSGEVAESLSHQSELVLVVVDRAKTDWNDSSYFVIDGDGQVAIRWAATPLAETILGQVIVVLRPKRIFDENNLREPWQMDD